MKLITARFTLCMIIIVSLLVFVGSLWSVKTAAAGGPWFVEASSGNDNNNCLSAGTACATVNGAIGKADVGDTINIGAGTYDEEIEIDQALNLVGAGADKTILTNSNGTAVRVADGSGNLVQFPVSIQDIAIQDASGTGLFTLETVTLQNVIVKNNGDRGIYNAGNITLTNSSLIGNKGVSGVAIINFDIANMTMENVSVHDNTGSNSIVHVQNTAHATLTNVTISRNYTGTALATSGSAVLTVTNTTIVNNTGNGIEDYSNNITMQNSVIANNGSRNCWADINSLGNNLEDGNTCGLDQASDITNTAAQLGLLTHNGGDLLTHAPLNGSPLIDAGANASCPAADARGLARPFDGDGIGGNLCDIGAVEYAAISPTSVAINAPATGIVSTNITIEADVTPATATTPITYTWTADGQTQVKQTSGTNDSVTFKWDSTGAKTINVTADNGLAQSSDSFQINIGVGAQPLTGVTISGSTSGIIDGEVTFTAQAEPINATQPVTYSWVLEQQSNITHVGGLSDQVTVSWADAGEYAITVTADNGVNSVVDTHTFTTKAWYVNASTGNDSNNCESPGLACATVAGALGKALPSGTIHIATGLYDEELSIQQAVKLRGVGANQTRLTNGNGAAVTINDFNNSTEHLVEMHDLSIVDAAGQGLSNSERLILSNSIVENNKGGGIGNTGAMTMTETIIRSNKGASGVAFFNSGEATMTAVSIYENSATNSVVHTQAGGRTQMTNVTISGNTGGTAIVSAAAGTVTILNSTIVDNPAGGLANYATITVQNSIVANNGTHVNGGNCFSTPTSLGHNLEDSDDCNFDQTGDLINTNPMLLALASHNGSTPTRSLMKDSPAIDAGSNSVCPAADQRGVARPKHGAGSGTAVCDIGSVEYEYTESYSIFLPMIVR